MKNNAFYTEARGQSVPWLRSPGNQCVKGGYPLAREKYLSEPKPPEVTNSPSFAFTICWKMLWVENK